VAYLTEAQINELYDDSLIDQHVTIRRYNSTAVFKLLKPYKHGMKGVVWKAKDDIGEDVALKIIPAEEYTGHSIIDEMTEARKLKDELFAQIKFFGDLSIENGRFSTKYKSIITEWIDGTPLDAFVFENVDCVDDFVTIAENLFRAIAVLKKHDLCHDDLHPGNVLIDIVEDPLTNESLFVVKIIDTGSIKRINTRERLLKELMKQIEQIGNAVGEENPELSKLKEFFEWKIPDDHLRAIECLLHIANSLFSKYSRLDFWERKFVDILLTFFQNATDSDLQRRLDDPRMVISELRSLVQQCKFQDIPGKAQHFSPFDFISAEMITSDKEFNELFSIECPWLEECQNLEPIYIYGPRGCGKSSVLRWLSFKTIMSDPKRNVQNTREIGVYVSCSVELRSRFWLLSEETIDELQSPIIKFFNLLLLEELFDTLHRMFQQEMKGNYDFGLTCANPVEFAQNILQRITGAKTKPRFQGQNIFEYIRSVLRRDRWETWSRIQQHKIGTELPDPALVADICRLIPEYFDFFKQRHITFLIDDYSNQRIPEHLQKKLNQTISFAKQGTPIFKVSSEYQGVNLEGIQEGREVIEVNVGEKYTSLVGDGHAFIEDILDLRLQKANYTCRTKVLLGESHYSSVARAIVEEKITGKFYYYGIDVIHQLCSGDVALALDLIKRIFDSHKVKKDHKSQIPPNMQHEVIQQFSAEEIRRIKNIVPYGEEMYDIVCYLGAFARAVAINKKSGRKDKPGEPVCMSHLDVRNPAITDLEENSPELANIYHLLKARAILFSLDTSRSRISGTTERLQIRRIYFPAFKAPLKRDAPIKIDSIDHLISLLNNPQTFVERELKKAGLDVRQLKFAFVEALVAPMEH